MVSSTVVEVNLVLQNELKPFIKEHSLEYRLNMGHSLIDSTTLHVNMVTQQISEILNKLYDNVQLK